MPEVFLLNQLWMVFLTLLTAAAYIMGFFLLLYLLRIARWYVREHDIPRLFAKKEAAERPPEGDGE